ncbi:MAG: 50S ribosomal protein L23 [Candidatus Dojkabacteria bacterium]|nr:50S ribosomal protein L23 [Candidatus Dojkabacteria bacterium]
MAKKLKYEILIKPLLTEKSLKLVEERNQYVFDVDLRAGKLEIKKAVEEKFKVKVEKVRIVRKTGKTVTWGRNRLSGRRKDVKKAIVTLASSDNIADFKVE